MQPGIQQTLQDHGYGLVYHAICLFTPQLSLGTHSSLTTEWQRVGSGWVGPGAWFCAEVVLGCSPSTKLLRDESKVDWMTKCPCTYGYKKPLRSTLWSPLNAHVQQRVLLVQKHQMYSESANLRQATAVSWRSMVAWRPLVSQHVFYQAMCGVVKGSGKWSQIHIQIWVNT